MNASQLWWLPDNPSWDDALRALSAHGCPDWQALSRLANARLDLVRTDRLDRAAQRLYAHSAPPEAADREVRVAILGSSTVSHLIPAIRVGLLRRRMWATVYASPYGQYLQELLDTNSALHAFQPTVILFLFDARHALGKIDPSLDLEAADSRIEKTAERFQSLWTTARRSFSCAVIQQTVLPVFPNLLGGNEHRLAGSPRRLIARLNHRLATLADENSVDLLGIDAQAAHDGIARWHDSVLWHQAKMEISPSAAPLYGDLVARLIAAQSGLSFKCLVLDLDNTLWGGVVGDDGVEGLVLGQGNALGEAFVAFQDYVRQLSRRGIILAVCSKNEEANALAPFHKHPEMVLKESDFAAFCANWTDKATNLRQIADRINIGMDAIVFADDNPVERDLVRRELPAVAVPELPEDPTQYAQCLSDAGYFESVRITAEDTTRNASYRANAEREDLRTAVTDVRDFLKSLEMTISATAFDTVGLTRIAQLINKTNQFNLTTRRYSEQEVAAMMKDPNTLTLQVRLKDRFGDNGMISVVIAKPTAAPHELAIDTWLMSCRVLGRQVEYEVLNRLVHEAKQRGCESITGEYRPTAKNVLVRDHYAALGFEAAGSGENGQTFWRLSIDEFEPFPTFITNTEVAA